MTTYSFKVTKGRYQLSFSTTDRDVIIEEFEKWVRKISEYVQKTKGQDILSHKKLSESAEKEITQMRAEEQLKNIPSPQVKQEEKSVLSEETQNNLDVFYHQPTKSEESDLVENSINSYAQGSFDSILDKSMQIPQSELSFKPSPSIKKDNAFLNYINGRKVERKIDYLLLTAYYFTQYEQKPRFTLKQLNAKLMQNIAVILDHSVVQEAINRDYIECLPDLTGVVGASEYRLTAYGEKTLLEEG